MEMYHVGQKPHGKKWEVKEMSDYKLKLDADEVVVLRELIEEALERSYEEVDLDTLDPDYDSDASDDLWDIRALLRLERKLGIRGDAVPLEGRVGREG